MIGTPTEYSQVELPLIEQLKGLGWKHLKGDEVSPSSTERGSFREVLLEGRLREAIRRINVDGDGEPWLDGSRVERAMDALRRLGASKLLEANERATELLLEGTVVEGVPERDGGRDQRVDFIDFERPERNDFLIVNQFRVEPPGGRTPIIPDAVLFVNGIPLVVVECKSPATTDPMGEAIDQLLRYSNQRSWVEEDEGAERLFHHNQLLVAASFHQARVGTVAAPPRYYLEWKDTAPVPKERVAAELGVENLSAQQTLVAGMLRGENLLEILRSFVLFQKTAGRTAKVVARYQQFRAVGKVVQRLREGQTRAEHGEADGRGGIVWHTQGSGKSLTMVFLVRVMRTLPDLRRFKVVVVTDRTDLERQLEETAALAGEPLKKARSSAELKDLLREEGAGLVFAMIQKVQDRGSEEGYPVLDLSEDIVLLVDEAHRSQGSTLHANLMRALPNCAKIGFTGTPILAADKKKTHEIFGPFIDRYTIKQSERDHATVPIRYEGRTADAAVVEGRSMDELFEDMFRDRAPEEREALKRKYATEGNVLEARAMISAKAKDMLRHYVDNVLPNGFKAQVVAWSRRAAVRYVEALEEACGELMRKLETLDPSLLGLRDEELAALEEEERFLARAHPYLGTLRRLEFAAIITGERDDPPSWAKWSAQAGQEERVARFKKPLVHEDPDRQDGLTFLCVRDKLLTGFDAPVEQVLYLDRAMKGHELLQAIARVNRTAPRKTHGLVVDYYGVARHLEEALAMYSDEDVEGALASIRDELPRLEDRHRRVLSVFGDRGKDLRDPDGCVDLLEDVEVRAEFVVGFKKFIESLDAVLPRSEALPYVPDAKVLGYINKAAANRYRDPRLGLADVGHKVKLLIDQHIRASGIDPAAAPVSLIDPDFYYKVEEHASDRAKASEMEHAARHHISQHVAEDPARYRALSERLEDVLERFEDNWEQLEMLRDLTRDIREGPTTDDTGLDPRTERPFMSVLETEAREGTPKEQLVELTREMVGLVRRTTCAVDFWRSASRQNEFRGELVRFLDDRDAVPFRRLEATADEVAGLAKALHGRLCP